MTTRICAKSAKNTIKIEDDALVTGRKKITFEKGAPYDNDEIKTEGGTGAAMGGDSIRIGDGTTNKAVDTVRGIIFNLPEERAELLARYIAWKEHIKEAKADYGDLRIVLTNLAYDDVATPADTVVGRFKTEGDNIVIDEDSFNTPITDWNSGKNQIKLWNVNIGNDFNADDYANAQTPNVDGNTTLNDGYNEEIEAFQETESLIAEIEGKIANWKTTGLPNDTGIRAELDKLEVYIGGISGNYKHDDATNVTLSTGAKTVTEILTTNRATNRADVKELAKKALFDLDTFGNVGGIYSKYYRDKIFGTVYSTSYGYGGLYQKLSELLIWRRCGFTTFEEIARANANDFCISNRGADVNLFDMPVGIPINGSTTTLIGDAAHRGKIFRKKFDGSDDADAPANITAIETTLGNAKTYRGFDMINVGEETVTVVSNANDHRHLVLEGFEFKQGANQKVNKKTIDDFRDMMSKMGYMADGSAPAVDGSNKGLEDKDTIKDRKDCMGYEIGEYPLGNHGIEHMYSLLTKVEVDILESSNRAIAIDLAFYGKDYDNTVKAEKIPNPNLELNEQSAKNFFTIKVNTAGNGFENNPGGTGWRDTKPTRVKILNNYYEVMKITSGQNTWADAKYDDVGAKGEIDKAYQAAKVWAEIWDRWTTSTKPDKAQAQADKIVLERYLEKNGTPTDEEKKVAASNPKWKTAMETALQEAKNVIGGGTPTSKMPQDAKDELEKLRDAQGNSDAVKKFYEGILEDFKKDEDVKKEVVDKIKEIVEAIKKVEGGNATESECDALIAYENSTEKAWTVATAIKVDGEDWAKNAVAKAKTRKGKLLQDAKDAAKTELGEEAFNVIKVDKLTKIKEVNDIKELFAKAKQAWGLQNKTDGQFDSLKEALEGAKDNDAWKAVNKWQKDKDGNTVSDGYAGGALKRLLGFKDKADKLKDKIKKAATPAEVRTEWENSSDKNQVDEKEMKGWQIYLELKNSNDNEEKELANVFSSLDDASDRYKNEASVLDKSLTEITKVIDILKKYKDKTANASGDKEEKLLDKIKKIDAKFGEPKDVINFWLTKLETQQKNLQQAKETRDKDKKQPESEEAPWYGTTTAYVAYSVLGVGAVIGLGWLAFKGDGEEGGNE
ncbi:MAG: hypothetical protein MRERC_1c109 [Mycoplasmataceae bacterium RC_NB112A]|nr:MAG: hypothetical protein MRERC_1c109 [Mycoplasmataceae bacterium RC_NB112A]